MNVGASTLKEVAVKRLILALSAVVLLVALSFAQQAASPAVPELPYQPVPDFFKVPIDRQLGDMAAVAVNSKGSVFMLSRSEISGPTYGAISGRVLEFDRTGKFVREIGRDLYAFSLGHGIRADKYDNIWVVDKGSDMIVKFRPDGQLDMVFGRRGEMNGGGNQPGSMPYIGPPDRSKPINAIGRFLGPTDVAWDSADNLYIADGYYNARVAKYNKNGDWVTSFGGEEGTGPGQFRTLHSIAIDAQDRIYIADRSNVRIQVFDKNFQLLHVWKQLAELPYEPFRDWFGEIVSRAAAPSGIGNPGAPFALCITPGPTQYLFVGDAFAIYKMTLDGKVLGKYGKPGRQPGQFGWVHGLACPSENELYAADENNFRVQKLVAVRTTTSR